MERREQTEEIGSIGLYELIGSFDDVINKFKKEKEYRRQQFIKLQEEFGEDNV
jgi:hypothetical protein